MKKEWFYKVSVYTKKQEKISEYQTTNTATAKAEFNRQKNDKTIQSDIVVWEIIKTLARG